MTARAPRLFLVTGGAGFIGSRIAAALAARGDDVVICDRLGQGEKWRNLEGFVFADLVDPDRCSDWLDRHHGALAGVVHMGAISATTVTDGDLVAERNLRFTRMLWDWCTERHRPLIYASSAATYGDGSAGFEDEFGSAALARLRPLNLYGWSKHAFDRFVAREVERGRTTPPHWVGLKFFNVYGPGEWHKGSMMSVVSRNLRPVLAGEPIRLFRSTDPAWPDGGQVRDFVWVGDCVAMVLAALERPDISGLFNCGTGRARTWMDLAHAIFAALGRDPRIELIDMPASLAPRYQNFTQASMAQAAQAGLPVPATAIEDGVRATVEALRRDLT